MAIFCPACGAQNDDWAQVCRQCGAVLRGVGTAQQAFQQGFQQPAGYVPQGYGGAGMMMGGGRIHASIGTRFLAQLIDGVVNFLASLPGFVLTFLGAFLADTDVAALGTLMTVLGYLLIFAGMIGILIYQVYKLGKEGATIGKKMMKICVLGQDGYPLGFGKALAREIVKGLIGQICFLLFLYPLIDKDKQALYDKLFGSNVWQQ
ncbi:MAG: RDD family protein [Acidobacteriota bacterium]|nr:RDD family protein [Blastocatellia bacterium]MDW8412220.1 RDD family protein [Acidobacteriota bacterium]